MRLPVLSSLVQRTNGSRNYELTIPAATAFTPRQREALMYNDELIWQVINHGHCAFKSK
jgi:hypothetical protein